MMRNSRRFRALVATGIVVVVAVAIGGAVSTNLWPDSATIVASSSAGGDNPNDLRARNAPPPYAPTDGQEETADANLDRTSHWSSSVDDRYVSLTTSWVEPTVVNRIRVVAIADLEQGFDTALISFSDGSNLHIHTNASGDVDVAFPAREVTSATLFIGEQRDLTVPLSLSVLHFDGSGPVVGGDAGEPIPSTSSLSDGTSAEAISDGALHDGELGAIWSSALDDVSPWAELRWDEPVALSRTQIFGSRDPNDADLWGDLVFSDGSRVRVSGVEAGGGPTTTAFAPRMATSMRFEALQPQENGPVVIAELVGYTAGVTPQRWDVDSASGVSVEPAAAVTCSPDSVAIGSASGSGIALVCPATGTSVSGLATVVVAGPPNTPLDVDAWIPARTGEGGALGTLASETTTASGRATFTFDVSRLPRGPFAVRVSAPDAPVAEQLYVQLFNTSGVSVSDLDTAPEGMTLQWAEEFTSPLSVSATGVGATYAALKPTGRGGENFGFAVFADPAWGEDTVATLADEYLRVRVQPIGDYSAWWGQEHLGGLISSAHTGGAGFAAQYGYFEARMLGAAGSGTWPAFWTLTSESATERGATTSDEVDIVELYGHNPVGSCHTLHDWFGGDDRSGEGTCLAVNGATNWALSWHTYSTLVTPGLAIFYIDGVEVARKEGLGASEEPYFYLANLALGGGWPIELSPSGNVVDLYVDWIRVYT